MWSRVAIKAIAAGTTPMSLVMFKVGALPGGTSTMRSHAAAALNAAH
jgi:hypothetical protein